MGLSTVYKISKDGVIIWDAEPIPVTHPDNPITYAVAVDPGLYGAGFHEPIWEPIATLPLETTTHKDSSVFTIGTGYDYRLLKVENGVVVTPPTLSGELELIDAPATIRLNWGSTAGLADPITVTYQDPDRVFIERK